MKAPSALAFLVATVCVAVLAVGCIDTVALVVVGVLAYAAALRALLHSEIRFRFEARLILWCAIGLCVLTVIQSVPLPQSVVHFLSPHAFDVWSRSLRPLTPTAPARWMTMTLEPQATRIELVRGLLYMCVFVTTITLTRSRGVTRHLERTLIVLSVVVVASTLVHEAFGFTRVWGLYRPRTDVTSIGPLLNTNHLAGYANIGLMLAAASALSSAPVFPRTVLAFVVVGLVAAEVWFSSRGAVACGVCGLTAIVAVTVSRPQPRVASRALRVTGPVVMAVCGAVLMVISSHDFSARGLLDTDLSKLAIARTTLTSMAAAYPGFGAGRGAFESTFPEFRGGSGYFVFTHPENIVAEWVSGWGVPVAVLSFVAITYAMRPATVLARSRPPLGAYVAFWVVALQNLVDFSMEIPGVMVSVIVCMGLVVGGDRGPSQSSQRAPRRDWMLAALGLSVLVSSGAALVGRKHELLVDKEVARDLPHSSASPADKERQLRDMMSAHPAEAYVRLAGALVAARERGPVPAWIGETISRSRVCGPAHWVLARWLRLRFPAQARLEYRLAQEQGLPWALPTAELATLVDGPFDAIALAPTGREHANVLDELSGAVDQRLPATSAQIDRTLSEIEPQRWNLLVREARRRVADLDAGDAAPWCATTLCINAATDAAHAVELAQPMRCAGYALVARAEMSAGRVTEGLTHLTAGVEQVNDQIECMETLATLAIQGKAENVANDALDHLVQRACASSDTCAREILFAASAEASRGHSNRSLTFLRRGVTLFPESDDVLSAHARMAKQLGHHREAAESYEKLVARHPGDPALAGELRAERSAHGVEP